MQGRPDNFQSTRLFMARTPTVSNEKILEAAYRVLDERGVDAFTVSDVAAATGLSRAAIILRFKSTRALKITLLSKRIEQYSRALADLPRTPSGNHLLEIAGFIGGNLGSRKGQSSFFNNYAINMQDPELAALEKKRGEAFHRAISRVMPATLIDQPSAVTEFVAHLSGSIISWIGADDEDPRQFLIARSKKWLALAGIPFDDPAPCETAGHPEPPA